MTAQQLETMKQVLELIKLSRENYGNDMYLTEAVDELETTLEQKEQEQEPVAYINQHGVIHEADYSWGPNNDITPLYKSPPQRKPLTDKEINALWFKANDQDNSMIKHFARAIEAAHNIKGEA